MKPLTLLKTINPEYDIAWCLYGRRSNLIIDTDIQYFRFSLQFNEDLNEMAAILRFIMHICIVI